ncbi:MAG: DUF4214 domain-containing protein [Lachnospiraceae bacterium]|nr:DUF4214 domain-containing protein [Lachnospiraceae bacterium]
MKRIKSSIMKVIFVGSISILALGLGSLKAHAASPVAINETNFPDATFRSVIANTYDYNHNGYIDPDEVSMTMNISCEGMGISSVKGIEYFTDIQGLWVKDNNISSLDVSKNVNLHGIWCSGNPLTSIDISHNPKLEWIYCFDCNLTALDVTHNPDMSFIECNTNPIKELDLSKTPKLEHLTCGTCELSSLDVSNCPNLAHLDAFSNHITTLDVSHNTKLKRLDIWNNPGLGSIDISNNKGLQYYNCSNNNAKSVDVSNNPELTKLICSYNREIKSLDVSHNPKLAYLDCAVNDISSLDLSNNPRLVFLQAFTNPFTSINIGNNPFLVRAYNEGVKKWEYPAGYCYSWTIEWGGETSTSDKNIFFVCVDDGVNVNANLIKDIHQIFPDDTGSDVTDATNLMTREELMQILYEMAGSPGVSGMSTRFKDVQHGAYYENAVIWGEANHIAVGYPHQSFDTFGVGKYIRREDACLMLMRYSEVMGLSRSIDFGRSDDYLDYYEIDYEHWEAVCWSATLQILEGKGGATKDTQKIDPRGRATRSDIQYMISRMQAVNYLPDYRIPSVADPVAVKAFVERLYLTVLGRDGEVKGINDWTNDLISRQKNGADVAGGFAMSREFKNRNLSNDEFLKVLYKGFFDREPDTGGYNGWISKLNSGTSREEVIAGFVNSTEFKNLCSRYGINPGELKVTPSPKPTPQPSNGLKPLNVDTSNVDEDQLTAFVQRLYLKALGRTGEASGVDYWKGCILNGKDSEGREYDIRTVISKGFFLSKEYANKNTSNEQFTADCYAAFFDRDPRGTEDEVNYNNWVQQLNNGSLTRQQMIEHGFGDSPEFKNLIKSYGFIILE